MATVPNTTGLMEETSADLIYPQREAAFFYGLFLRGYSPEQLRRDIEVPPEVMLKWGQEANRAPENQIFFKRMVEYRRHVLALFDALVGYDEATRQLQ
jgi:hypothetical protein